MTSRAVRSALSDDAEAMGWTVAELLAFRAVFGVPMHRRVVPETRLTSGQFRVLHRAIPRALRPSTRARFWGEEPLRYDPTAQVRCSADFRELLGWWRDVENAIIGLPVEASLPDWRAACLVVATDRERWLSWRAVAALSEDGIAGVLPLLPRALASS